MSPTARRQPTDLTLSDRRERWHQLLDTVDELECAIANARAILEGPQRDQVSEWISWIREILLTARPRNSV
jgi:dsDNA-binding SOS-regulon protein